ncbi:putative disease resistance protein rga3, partial [Nicotiana attenuata]
VELAKQLLLKLFSMNNKGPSVTPQEVVFNDERVKHHFNLRAWVCVSENYDALRITIPLLEEVGAPGIYVSNEQHTDWDMFRSSLRQGAIGSMILVTTCSEKVTLIMGSEPCHYLSPVEDEDCWCLFEKRAFGLIDPIVYSKLHGIWKHIVKKCKGLPLVVKTVAVLLHLKLDVEEWEEVLASDIWRDAASANLKDKKQIENLVMEWSSDSDHVEDSLGCKGCSNDMYRLLA